jgi:hypothetical protein
MRTIVPIPIYIDFFLPGSAALTVDKVPGAIFEVGSIQLPTHEFSNLGRSAGFAGGPQPSHACGYSLASVGRPGPPVAASLDCSHCAFRDTGHRAAAPWPRLEFSAAVAGAAGPRQYPASTGY